MTGRAPRAILFDLDETLSDRALSIARHAERFQRDFGQRLAPIAVAEIAAALRAADGDGYRGREAIARGQLRLLPWLDPPDAEQLTDHWLEWFPHATTRRDGLVDVFEALRAREIALGLITNGVARGQLAKLERLAVRPYLSSVLVSEVVGVAKPDARIFALALAELGCDAATAWFVGDHPINDVLGAAAAGLQPVWLSGVHPWPAEHPAPHQQIAALPDLLDLLQRTEA